MKEIDRLLEKYWQGETSIEEEKIIKSHFASNSSPKEDNNDILFSFFEKEKLIKYKGDLSTTTKPKVIKFNLIRKIAVAASIVFMISIGYFAINNSVFNNSNNYAKNEITDKDEARKVAEEALALLAINFNKGEKAVSENIQNLDKINIINTIIKIN